MHKHKMVAIFLTVVFAASTLVFAGGAKRKQLFDPSMPPKPFRNGEVIVKFKKGVTLNEINNIASFRSLEVKKNFKVLSKAKGKQYVLLKSSSESDAILLAKTLQSDARVESATPNYLHHAEATPNDTNFSSLWGMHNTGQTGGTVDADIDAPEAWDITTGSSSVIVVVIDSGITYNHPDLIANVWTNPGEIAGNNRDDDSNGYRDDVYGIDPANNDRDPLDDNGHGTHCAGTIGAVGNNSLGVAGVNWNVKIMGLKFLDAEGNGANADAIECIEYAVYEKQNHGQNIVAINASWGSTSGSQGDALCDAIEIACNAGIVFCAAAGNGGSDGVGDDNDATPHYPSSYNLAGIIAVAATDHNDALTDFSNYGATSVDLGAPGEDILSTIPPKYVPQSGGIFFDNCTDTGNWVTSGTNNSWAITNNREVYFGSPNPEPPSPDYFWSDSPINTSGYNYGLYLNNTNSYLTYASNINLSSYAGQNIYFGMWIGKHLANTDYLYIQFSRNGGSNWTTVYTIGPTDGYIFYWDSLNFLIPETYKTAQFQMRFNLVTDNANRGIGVVIDNIGIGSINTYYEAMGGTSMACPHVAGAVGLIASQFSSETVAQRKARILNWGDYKSSLDGRTVTCKRLNVYRSLFNPSVTITSPNGGENWMVGTAHNITWTWLGAVNNVDIDYSINGGTSWTSIASNQPNSGTYSWTVPTIATPQNNCLVRVREYGCTTSVTDQSDAVFSIVAYSSETVSTPSVPYGQQWGFVGVSNTYTFSGSVSSLGDPVQYLIDWGDGAGAGADEYKVGSDSGWLPVGMTAASHAWSATGTYTVRAKARCATHPGVESAWSTSIPVTIGSEPTWAAVTRFGACSDSGQPTVEWQTGTESGTVGYNLWRKDRETGKYEQVNQELLPALANAPQGGAYRLADPGALSFEPVIYQLEEIDAQGRSLTYGPFTVVFGGAPGQEGLDREPRLAQEEPTGIYGFQRFARAKSLYEEARLNARRQELSRATLQAGSGKERARVTVKGRGLFYVTAGQVASALGVSESLASSLINGHNLKLTALGNDVGWLADNSGAGLFFYNEGKETLYSDKNVYFIERGSGLAMDAVNGGNAGPAPDGQTYAETLRFTAGKYFLPSQDKDRLADDWMWEVVAAGGAGKTFALDVPGVAGSGQAKLRVVLRGATDTEAANDHHAVVKVNGTEIGSGYWDGGNDYALELTFSASQLTDGGNTVEVSGALDMGAPYSIFYVDSLELSYARRYQAKNNALICKAGNNAVITVSGLTELQAVVLDVTVPRRPLLLTGVVPDVAGRVTFVPRNTDREYLVSGLNAALRPISVVGDRPSTLKGRTRPAEYIVIAPEEFASAAQELADYRKGKGLKTLVVTLEDIYDAFSFGVTDPYALRAFLAYANKNWGKVKYAVLAGKGTYDYNDYLGNGDNLVPALLAKSAYGYYAADRVYGDITGKNLVPEIATGRLPAVTNAELRAMIAKVKAYESGQGAWTDKALWIADDGSEFDQGNTELAGIAQGFVNEKIVLAGSADETRTKINVAWNAGAALVTYCGHGGITQLTHENIFDIDDADALTNGEQLPLATLLTCVAGRFEVPGYTSLAEVLALNSAGGMAGGLAPSGAALHEDSLRLAEEFYKAAYRAKAASAGVALVEAMKKYVQQGGKAELLNIYNWIGDPALSIK